MTKKSGFWDFESSSKIDVLIEGQHTRQILLAMADPETRVLPQERDFIVYGNSEALLVCPRSPYLRFSLYLIHRLASLLHLT